MEENQTITKLKYEFTYKLLAHGIKIVGVK